jgi:hypothetical protein
LCTCVPTREDYNVKRERSTFVCRLCDHLYSHVLWVQPILGLARHGQPVWDFWRTRRFCGKRTVRRIILILLAVLWTRIIIVCLLRVFRTWFRLWLDRFLLRWLQWVIRYWLQWVIWYWLQWVIWYWLQWVLWVEWTGVLRLRRVVRIQRIIVHPQQHVRQFLWLRWTGLQRFRIQFAGQLWTCHSRIRIWLRFQWIQLRRIRDRIPVQFHEFLTCLHLLWRRTVFTRGVCSLSLSSERVFTCACLYVMMRVLVGDIDDRKQSSKRGISSLPEQNLSLPHPFHCLHHTSIPTI